MEIVAQDPGVFLEFRAGDLPFFHDDLFVIGNRDLVEDGDSERFFLAGRNGDLIFVFRLLLSL